MLLTNILPTHVGKFAQWPAGDILTPSAHHPADFYLSNQLQNELYYEEYDNVAVMFASIKNFDTDKIGLRVLNEIICDFDDVVSSSLASFSVNPP